VASLQKDPSSARSGKSAVSKEETVEGKTGSVSSDAGDEIENAADNLLTSKGKGGSLLKHGGDDDDDHENPTLREILIKFGHIQLNKDFYDSIKKTESQSGPSDPLGKRQNDRQAFESGLQGVKTLILENVHRIDPNWWTLERTINHLSSPTDVEELNLISALPLLAVEIIDRIAQMGTWLIE